MQITPLGNKVVIKRAAAQTSKGGIFLPDSAQEKPRQGEVIAVGPGLTNDEGKRTPMEVQKGEMVLFGAYAGREVPGDEELLILSEDEILAVVEAK